MCESKKPSPGDLGEGGQVTLYACKRCALLKHDSAQMPAHDKHCGGDFFAVEYVPLARVEELEAENEQLREGYASEREEAMSAKSWSGGAEGERWTLEVEIDRFDSEGLVVSVWTENEEERIDDRPVQALAILSPAKAREVAEELVACAEHIERHEAVSLSEHPGADASHHVSARANPQDQSVKGEGPDAL